MKRHNHRLERCCIGLILIGSATSATAQQSNVAPGGSAAAARGPGTGIEEIIVTSQKRAQRLQKVPIAVTAFSAKDIAASGISSATDLGQHVAALTISVAGGGAVLPFLRGVGNPDSVIGNEASIAVYLDDVYIPRLDASFLELSDISRIEVLKGPQGTLFGRNASAGVISIFTKDPSKTFQADASIGYGNYNTSTEKLYIAGPVAPGVVANLSVLNSNQADGWGRNVVNNTPVGYNDPFLIRSKWIITLSDTTTLRLSGDYSRSSSDEGLVDNFYPGFTSGSPAYYTQPPYNLPQQKYKNAVGFYDSQDDGSLTEHKTGFGLSARLNQDLGFGLLSSISAYRQTRETVDVDGDFTPFPSLEYDEDGITRTFTQEVQLASKAGSPFDWLAGLFYANEFAAYQPINITGQGLATDVLGGGFGPVLPPGSQVNLFSQQRVKDYAGFGQVTFHLGHNTDLTGGYRFTLDDIDAAGRTQAVLPGIFPGNGAFVFPGSLNVATEFQKSTYKVSVDHRFTDKILTYMTLSRGFKAGTYNLLPLTVPVTKPEVLTSFEIGAKTTLLNNRLQLNGAVFHYDLQDPQVITAVNHLVQLSNANAAKVDGVDIEGQFAFSPDLTSHFGGEYLNSRYTNFPNAPFILPNTAPPYGALQAVPSNADGNQLPNAPKFAFNAGINYNLDVAFGRFDLNTNYAFHGTFKWNPDDVVKQKSYGLLDASLTYMLPNTDRWSLRLWGKNITQQKYATTLLELTGPAGYVFGPGAPAEYGATLSYHFGS